ncbi:MULTISPECIES: sigma-54 dependent transcriptional regulator [unclassified Pseudomonas]|uniref:sigma-54-dependent transcriptional regulator n=1 Tax=unclassified Pseudomonas TaxID=196821 RepID=UPI001F586415|nr:MULTISPECIES: sigma-54 dependent transcriptional regulator [unclassified Pseudomonas]
MSILLVDDDAAFRESLGEALEDLGYAVVQAGSTRQALDCLSRHSPALAIVDLRMHQDDGLTFLREARTQRPEMPCVILTGYASSQNTIEAMRLGAFDHLTKPIGREPLRELLLRALPPAEPAAAAPLPASTDELIGDSEAMRQVFKLIGQAAASDATVMILGETGTGKEMVASALHRNGPRAQRPFIAVNCAAIPADLLESELFGHVKGAFTGAHADRLGRFREAQGGTLFLDEIGDMSLVTQAKILRVLQERQVSPLGSSQNIAVDVRLVAATHRDLTAWIEQGQFREDLWYRLQVITVQLPPLRERQGDIVALAEHFLQSASGGPLAKRLSAQAIQGLLNHTWPGNVRELRNAMQRAALLGKGTVIDVQALGLTPPTLSSTRLELDWEGPLEAAVAAVEREMIVRALVRAGQNRAEAARLLGISRQQLYRKIEQLHLQM